MKMKMKWKTFANCTKVRQKKSFARKARKIYFPKKALSDSTRLDSTTWKAFVVLKCADVVACKSTKRFVIPLALLVVTD